MSEDVLVICIGLVGRSGLFLVGCVLVGGVVVFCRPPPHPAP